MRTILALATAVLLFAPGCGDSTTTTDMPVAVIDMTMTTPADMTKSCKSVLSCAQKCLGMTDVVGCATACAGTASPAVQQTFGALSQCIFMHCVLDASATQLGVCVGAVVQGACATQYAACM
jgi:hypothetical protein